LVVKSPKFQARDENYVQKVRQSFARQKAMRTIGIEIDSLEAGRIVLVMNFAERFTQQHGFIHGGIITTALDSACGYAALSLMDREAAVLTVEFKTSFIAPARGNRFVIEGQVVKPGRNLTFTEAQAWAITGSHKNLVASMSATMMSVRDRQEITEAKPQ